MNATLFSVMALHGTGDLRGEVREGGDLCLTT